MPEYLSEKQVVQIWTRHLLERTPLVVEGGQALEILYPGRANDDRGADFRDAVIAVNREKLKGDIEVHVRSSDWQAHGHHNDASYNRVILHVVMWHDTRGVTVLQDGREVPILAMESYTNTPEHNRANGEHSPVAVAVPCRQSVKRMAVGAVAAFLESAGEMRFKEKAAGFQAELSHAVGGQVLYQGIMEALGYARNRPPFLELARRLPLHVLEEVTRSQMPDGECFTRLHGQMLGTAGLLPGSQFNNSMPPQSWDTFKVRPQNSPSRRQTAMCYLLRRYRKTGILEGLVGKLAEAQRVQDHNILEKALIVSSGDTQGRSMALLGRERAADIIINVLIPFGYAWGRTTGQPELMQNALDLYRRYPQRAENSIERHMIRQLGLRASLAGTAQRQQGLIHIYKTLCIQGKCGHCRLDQLKPGYHVHT
ncbi:MAG: DUF2851 family protein [Chloroflexi bacterium]|nr:DUF2851 family protein [Chloroflexota bacterium]